MDVTLVPTDEIWRVWPRSFEHILKSINASGKMDSINNVLEELLSNHTTLWIAIDDDFVIRSSATLRKIMYADGTAAMKICHVGGENGMDWFRPMYHKFIKFSSDNKCNYLQSESVPEVEPVMKRYKAEELYRVYRISIPENVDRN